MKIVGTSNFDNETTNDVLIAENVPEHYAPCMVEALNNKHSGDHATYFFSSKPDEYKLYEWSP